MLEKYRLIKQFNSESAYQIFNYILFGSDAECRQDILLTNVSTQLTAYSSTLVDEVGTDSEEDQFRHEKYALCLEHVQ